VERLGVELWLAANGSESSRAEYAQFDDRRRQFRALLLATCQRLRQLYGQDVEVGSDRSALAAMKSAAMKDFRDEYSRLRRSWGDSKIYDNWVDGANNAAFGAQAAYDDLVPTFETLFDREDKDWQRFYDAVRRLTWLTASEREKALKQITLERSIG
jgi:predicted aminopeptidase